MENNVGTIAVFQRGIMQIKKVGMLVLLVVRKRQFKGAGSVWLCLAGASGCVIPLSGFQ